MMSFLVKFDFSRLRNRERNSEPVKPKSRSAQYNYKRKLEKEADYKAFKERDAKRKKLGYISVNKMDEVTKANIRKEWREKKRKQRTKATKQQHEQDPNKKKWKDLTPEERKKYYKMKMRIHRGKLKKKTKGHNPSPQVTPNKKNLSNSTLYRKIKAAKQVLPNNPENFATVVTKLLGKVSPRKKKALSNRGLIDVKTGLENKQIVQNLSNAISISKRNPSNKNRDVLYKLLKYSAGKKWSLAKKLGSSRKVWCKVLADAKVKKQRKLDAIPDEVKRQVDEYWLSSEVSRPLPLKKAVKNHKPLHLLEYSYVTAFLKFKQKFPDVKIGYVKFLQLKPDNVRHMKALERIMCCCMKCENVKLKANAINTMALKSNMTQFQRIPNVPEDISAVTLCKNPMLDCINRKCMSCGTKGIHDKCTSLLQSCGHKNTEYKCWEKTKKSMMVKGIEKDVTRIERVRHETSLNGLVDQLSEDLEKFSGHIFRAGWQQRQLMKAKACMRPRSSIIIMDYAENYQCSNQDEVQSAHWSQVQATIHPMMAYVNASDAAGPFSHKEAIVVISNDLKHDSDAVAKYISCAHDHLIEKFNIVHAEHFSDCAASQYRNRFNLANLSQSKLSVKHNYFEPSHGKSAADGVGAVVKQEATKAVTRRTYEIGDAKELYNFCTKELSTVGRGIFESDKKKYENSGRVFMYIEKDEIQRPGIYARVKPVTGIQKVHCVASTGTPLKVMTRNLSCFCDFCNLDIGESCLAARHVNQWKSVDLQMAADQNITVQSSPNQYSEHGGSMQIESRPADSAVQKEHENRPHYEEGQFVLMSLPFGKKMKDFVGEIMEISGDEVHISYMAEHKKTSGTYIWPSKQDTSWELKSSIKRILPTPSLLASSSTNRTQLYSFE